MDEFVHEAAARAEPPDDKPAATAAGAQPEARQALRAAALKSASAASLPDREGAGRRVLARSYECGPGCVVGSTDFYLARPHGTRAVCRSAVSRVLRVSRSGEAGGPAGGGLGRRGVGGRGAGTLRPLGAVPSCCGACTALRC